MINKFRLLITNPKLFYKKVKNKIFSKKPAPKKPAPKKPAPKKPAPNIQSLLIHNINFAFPYNFILHTGEKSGALAHLNIWIPYFEYADVDYIIVCRHLEAYKNTILKYPSLKIIYAKNKSEIDYIFNRFNNIKACFYPSNTGNNIHLLYENNVKHIFIGHGDSDKTASAHKFFRIYDENWVAGEAHIDRFKNANFSDEGLRHIKIGRPNLYEVVNKSKDFWRDRLDNYNLLYLPTWEGTYKEQDYSSLSIIKENIEILNQIDNLNIQIKLHPFSGNREKEFLNLEKELKNSDSCTVIDKMQTVNESISESNIFICDISAVVSECLAGNAPIFIYIPVDKKIKISQSKMPYEYYCYTFSTSEELLEKLQLLLDGDDYLYDKREKAMEYILNTKDTLNFTFKNKLLEIEGN